jgi:hypothetical protein
MAETKPTGTSVDAHLDKIPDEQRPCFSLATWSESGTDEKRDPR